MIAPLVRRFYSELWEKGERAEAAEILADTLVFRGSLGIEAHGVDAFWAYLVEIRTALADYRCDIQMLIAETDRAAAKMKFSGRHIGALMNVPPSGRTVTWSGAAFFTARERRPTEIWVLGDVDGLRAELRSH